MRYSVRSEMNPVSKASVARRQILFGLLASAAFGNVAFSVAGSARADSAKSDNISSSEALARARRGEVTIIDVRSPQEWRQTGLPAGAKAVSIHDPDGIEGFVAALRRSVGNDLDRPVALICARGNRSTRAQNALQAAGFTQVLNIKEGMLGSASGPGWLARELPLESCHC